MAMLRRIAAAKVLKRVPAVGGDDGADDLPPSFQRNVTPVFFQLASRHRINAITFAKGWPVQAVGLVEHHFVILRRPGRPVLTAVQYLNKLLAPSARRVRDRLYGMWASAPSRLHKPLERSRPGSFASGGAQGF